MVEYPSVSICKKYALEWDLGLKYSNITDTNEALTGVLSLTYGLEEQIYFLTHPGVNNLTFPCTTYGGYTPGTPCLFPVIYENKTHYKCSAMGKIPGVPKNSEILIAKYLKQCTISGTL